MDEIERSKEKWKPFVERESRNANPILHRPPRHNIRFRIGYEWDHQPTEAEIERVERAIAKAANEILAKQEAWIKHMLQMARDGEVATLRKERDAALATAQARDELLMKARRWIVAGHPHHDVAAANGCDVCMAVAEIDAALGSPR